MIIAAGSVCCLVFVKLKLLWEKGDPEVAGACGDTDCRGVFIKSHGFLLNVDGSKVGDVGLQGSFEA